jgi:hypothetical protein
MERLAALVLVLGMIAGCGGNAARTRAADALGDTRIALTDLDAETSGGESPAEVRDALDRATVRLEETEHALDLWRGATGSLAYERMAACLAASLDTLREALGAAGMPISVELESAEAALGTTTDRECAHAEGGE